MENILFCGAVESEIHLLKKEGLPTFEVGIGIINTVLNLTQYLLANDVDKIVFCGTVGAYKSTTYKIGDIVTSDSHQLIGPLSVLKKGYFPEQLNKQINFEGNKLPLNNVKTGTVLEITQEDDLAERIHKFYKVDIEHMELYGLAKVCEAFHVQLIPVVGVANFVGDESHSEWVKNNISVSNTTQSYVLDHLNLF